MEAKLAHQLEGLSHELILLVLLDARKAYYYLEGGICTEIMRGYVLGNNLHRLMQCLWEDQ